MGWNGSGVFTKTYSWVADAANGIKIRADRHDTNDTDFQNGINNCITKDGQNAATANLPMGTYKHTNVGNATARTQYVSMGQRMDNGGLFYVTTGTANAYIVTASPTITAYATGQAFDLKFSATNTGSSTVNISSVGTTNLVKNGSNALSSGDLVSGTTYRIVYDGTNFQVANYSATPASVVNSGLAGLSSANMATGDSLFFTDANDSDALKTEGVIGLLKLMMPVGFVVQLAVSTSPATLYGFGTWQAIEDRFIVGHGSTYTGTGGSATDSITISEANLPSSITVSTTSGAVDDTGTTRLASANTGSTHTVTTTLTNFGSGTAISVDTIPPYKAVYIWERTA